MPTPRRLLAVPIAAILLAVASIAGSAGPVEAYQGSTYEQLIEDEALTDQHAIVIRFYAAVFGRTPDNDGVRFWLDQYDTGEWSTRRIANFFATSDEFRSLYGDDTDDAEFVAAVYPNVLGREPDAGGFEFWVGYLQAGNPRAEMILLMSNAPEFIEANRLPFELDAPEPVRCEAATQARLSYAQQPDILDDGELHQAFNIEFDMNNTGTQGCGGSGFTPVATLVTLSPGPFSDDGVADSADYWTPVGTPGTVWIPIDDTQFGGITSTYAMPTVMLRTDVEILVETAEGHVVTWSDVVVDVDTSTRQRTGDPFDPSAENPTITCYNLTEITVRVTEILYLGDMVPVVEVVGPTGWADAAGLVTGCPWPATSAGPYSVQLFADDEPIGSPIVQWNPAGPDGLLADPEALEGASLRMEFTEHTNDVKVIYSDVTLLED